MFKHLIPVIFSLIILACSDSNNTPSSVAFDLTCDLTLNFTPVADAIATTGTGTPATTVIALHGKNGSALSSTVANLANDLNAAGYDVIRPYMPWSNFNWTGDMCDAMAYLNSLVETEINAGKSVVLMGHSMGSPAVLSYAALTNTTKPDALVVIAPGHFVGTSSNFDSLHTADVSTAKNMVTAGNGDVISTFQTSNGGVMQSISTTPNIYLSFHDPNEFPNILSSVPLITQPTLWLAGLNDSLTASAQNLGIISAISNGSNYDYREIAGDHYTVIDNVTAEFDPWYQALP